MPSLDPAEDFSQVLVRQFLQLCENPRTRARMLRLVKGSTGSARAGRRLYAVVNRLVLHPAVRRTGLPDSTTRWEMVASQLIGIAVLRYVVRLEPIASASVDEVVALTSPAVLAILQPAVEPVVAEEPVERRRGLAVPIVVPVPRTMSVPLPLPGRRGCGGASSDLGAVRAREHRGRPRGRGLGAGGLGGVGVGLGVVEGHGTNPRQQR